MSSLAKLKTQISRNSSNDKDLLRHSRATDSPIAQQKMSREEMRRLMPITAEWVDWLRAELGAEAADAIVRAGMRGEGGFWMREQGPDGVWREFGSRRP